MDFQQAQSEYRKLKADYDAGRLSEEALRDQVAKLLVEDAQGRWWSIGYETGQWYVHDGVSWVEGVPPGPKTAASEPQAGATEPPPRSEFEPQPSPTTPPQQEASERSGVERRMPSTPAGTDAERRKRSLPWVIVGIVAAVVVGAFLISQLTGRQASRATMTRVANATALARRTEIAGTATAQAGAAALRTAAAADRATRASVAQTTVAVSTLPAIDTQSPKPTAPPTKPPLPTVILPPHLTAPDVVNVRAGPGTNYPVIGRLMAEQSENIIGRNAGGDWWQIDYNGVAGWVAASVVKASISMGAAVPMVEAPPTPTARPTATALARCRIQPGAIFAPYWDREVMGCPLGPEKLVWSAYESFERGAMLWREDTNRIYVFFGGGYRIFQYPPTETEYWCVGAKNVGDPRRGFGRAWCENPEIRARVGNAMGRETGERRPIQEFEQGFMVRIGERGTSMWVDKSGVWREQR